jgi:hypothetical protein
VAREHQLLLLETGVYYTELEISMPKSEPAAKAKAREHGSKCRRRAWSPPADRARTMPSHVQVDRARTTPTSAAARASGTSAA